MHAFKGAWAGQTFALATYNEAGGKKTRIRRSKEERKTLVEMFIKRYQKSNDGNFPSLNLTHKEVGGSFYTVRELVREIIQENRVLGPAKLDLEGRDIDILLENSPLGTISVEPKESLSSSYETQTTSFIAAYQNQVSREEFSENGNARKATEVDKFVHMGEASYPDEETSEAQQRDMGGQLTRSDLQTFDGLLADNGAQISDKESNAANLASEEVPQFDKHDPGDENLKSNEQVINGTSQATEEIEIASLEVEKDGEKKVKQLEESNSLQTPMKPDILVEKFPLHPVGKKSDALEGTSEVQHQVAKTMELTGNKQEGLHVSKDASRLMIPKVDSDISSQQVKEGEPVDETSRSKVISSSLGSSKYSTIKGTEDPQRGTKPVNSPPAFSGNANKMKSSSPEKNSTSQEPVGVKYKLNIEHKSAPEEGVESRFERVKLEKEKEASQTSSSSEITPLLALLKAFVDAFVKFWSE